MRRAWKTMGPPPRMMPQHWTAHRSSLTRSLWPSEAHIVGTGSPNDAPNDAQTMPSLMEPHLPSTPGPSTRRISKRDAVRPQPKKASKQEEQGAAEDMTKHRTTRLCCDSASFVISFEVLEMRAPRAKLGTRTRDVPPCSGNYAFWYFYCTCKRWHLLAFYN